MERSEPTLVPEWLKNSGTLNGGASTSRSDDQIPSKLGRNKSFLNGNGKYSGRSFSSDKTSSSYFRWSSSGNGSGHPKSRSSLGRSQQDWDWKNYAYEFCDKDRSFLRDHQHRDFSGVLGNALLSKFETDKLRRSQLLFSGKRGDTCHKKVTTDSSTASTNKTNSLLSKSGPIDGFRRVSFERDFPSLGAEERAVTPEVGRVQSPGLSSAVQSLPTCTSAINSSEKWTSALAEVPALVGSTGAGVSSLQQATPSSCMSVALGATTGLNMAEAVSQVPNCVQSTATQLSVGTQKLEELAIKQSRQLIPVMPSMEKSLVLNSSDKQKTTVGQQQHLVSSSLVQAGSVMDDTSKPSNVGKLHVLKPLREKNGAAPLVKDNLSPTCSKPVSLTCAAVSVSPSAATTGPTINQGHEHKPMLEKQPTVQAQSRNDFFNSVRKKSMQNSSVADSSMRNLSSVLVTGTVVSPSSSDKLPETDAVCVPNTSEDGDGSFGASLSRIQLSETRGGLNCNVDACVGLKHDKTGDELATSDPIFPEEEEAAFLRSMGWEENADEGGLTEEEISTFFRDITKYINSKPTLKIPQGLQPKSWLPLDSHICGISSGLTSSDAKLES